MTHSIANIVTNTAVVARPAMGPKGAEQYLTLTPSGAPVWTSDPRAATSFESVREACRAAARLPSALRAFGLPYCGRLGDLDLH